MKEEQIMHYARTDCNQSPDNLIPREREREREREGGK